MPAEAPITSREGLLAWVATALKCSPDAINENDSLIELGLSSLMMMRLPVMLKKQGVSVKLADMLKDATVASWLRLMAGGQGSANEETLQPVADGQPFALTDMQRAYWLGRQAIFPLGGIAAHGYLEIEAAGGGFDLPRLEEALNKTIAVHPVLRMVLTTDGHQTVLGKVPRYTIEYSHGPEERAKCRTAMQAEILPAHTWPLFKVCMTGSDDSPHKFLHISFDILLLDIASLALWLRQWHGLYVGTRAGIQPHGRHFSQYLVETENKRTSRAAEEHRSWWRARVDDLPRAPQLPLARQPRELTPPAILRLESRIEPEAAALLRGQAARAGVTAAGLFTAILALGLSRFSRFPHMTLNLTLFDRSGERAAYDGILGDFTSMLPVAVRTGDGQSFASLCQAVHAEIFQALSHAEVSGAEVSAEIARAQGISNENPLPVVLTCATGDGAGSYLDAAALFGKLVFARNQAPQTWIDVQVVDYQGGISVIWDYVDGLFPDGLIDEMFGLFMELCREVTGGSAWSAAAQSLCVGRMEPAVLDVLPGADRNLVAPFLENAIMHPAAPALITPEKTVSYGELERLSRALAQRLAASGLVQRGSLVGVALPRGWRQIVAVLGVLRAGAAYLPVSVNDPADRIALIFAEGNVAAVVCDDERARTAPDTLAKFVVDEDAPAAEVASEILLLPADPDDVAYVIFTSGSTGKPKGVAVSHQAALNTILDVNFRNTVTAKDRLFAVSQLNFDLSVYDIFGALAVGAALVIPTHAAVPDPHEWVRQVEAERVTVWNSVPALAQLLIEAAHVSGGSIESLRLFMLSGDWLPVDLAKSILALTQRPRLVSMGGATEAAIWSVEKVVETVAPDQKTIPYGKPLSGQILYVLDAAMRLCPQWTPGEIHIAGVGLAEGYLHRPELTDKAFVLHPVTGERLYRTGDWGRLLPDGDIEFLGREDSQVKINGMRIELGEIEAAITALLGVRQAVAVITENGGIKQIAAFAVPDDTQAIDEERLREALKKKLPHSWLPSVLCLESTLPLSANGKVDRKALAVRARHALHAARPGKTVLPETEGQQKIADVWASVLNGARPGLSVSFFDAGGTSFLAMQLASRLAALLEQPVPVISIFQYTTIASQAKHFIESEALQPMNAGRGQARAQKLGVLAARARQRGRS
ncbi:amino acid adenylation domain-containing protein [Desulfovibrio sp.]|uniref:amino acid adenylation domain-containing protein n=1 Tax=Desulfovibrio sp. TaxID=885 RepID=UPI0025BB4BF3|nr:amino acid adenylation domain-containing protein [Desulfovibrio sp.]